MGVFVGTDVFVGTGVSVAGMGVFVGTDVSVGTDVFVGTGISVRTGIDDGGTEVEAGVHPIAKAVRKTSIRNIDRIDLSMAFSPFELMNQRKPTTVKDSCGAANGSGPPHRLPISFESSQPHAALGNVPPLQYAPKQTRFSHFQRVRRLPPLKCYAEKRNSSSNTLHVHHGINEGQMPSC
jgi:hypothetical protein